MLLLRGFEVDSVCCLLFGTLIFHCVFVTAPTALNVSRVKAEPSVEPGVPVQAVTPSPNPAGSNSTDLKPGAADSIQTSGAYCSREENLKKEVGFGFFEE